MTPTQSIINAKVSEMHAAVPSAGARVLALLISEATSLEHPNQKAAHQRTSLVYPWKVPVTMTKTTIGPTDTRNRHTLPIDPCMQMQYTTCLLAFQTSTRALVLRVPVHFVLLFAFASLSS